MTHRHIGGSLLPSNNHYILQPIATSQGELQVRVLAAEDTHGLFAGDVLLAKHPNGFSCRELAERIQRGHRCASEQADFIVRCGGHVTEAGRAVIAASQPPVQGSRP